MEATAHFAPQPDQAATARSFVRRTMVRWEVPRVDDVVLMASELFTNAVLHGHGDIEVTLSLSGGHVRLEVSDGGGVRVPDRLQPPVPGALSGRGLAIVDTLAARWGNSGDDAGRTRVWLEVPSH